MDPSENVPRPGRRGSSSSVIVTRVVPLILVVQVLLTLIIYPFLPNIVPSHWNGAGQVDSYEPKWVYAGFLPVFSLGLYVFLGALFVFIGSKRNDQDPIVQQKGEMGQTILKLLMLLQQVIFIVTQVILLTVALRAGSGAVH